MLKFCYVVAQRHRRAAVNGIAGLISTRECFIYTLQFLQLLEDYKSTQVPIYFKIYIEKPTSLNIRV